MVYTGVMGIEEGTRVQQLLGWLGEPVRIRLRMDASAARSVLCHQGVGRIRHLEVKVLWIQDMTNCGRLLVDSQGHGECGRHRNEAVVRPGVLQAEVDAWLGAGVESERCRNYMWSGRLSDLRDELEG